MAVTSRPVSPVSLVGPNPLFPEQTLPGDGGGNPLNQTIGTAARALRLAALLCSGANSIPGAPAGTFVSQPRLSGDSLPRFLGSESPSGVLTPPPPVRDRGASDVEVARSSRQELAAMVQACEEARANRRYPSAATHLTDAVSLVCHHGPLFPKDDVDAVRLAGSGLRTAISEELRINRADQGLADCMQLVSSVMEKFAQRYGQTR